MTPTVPVGSRIEARPRRKRGSGSIYRASEGGWIAAVRRKDGRKIKRRAPDYPEAKHQLALLIREFRRDLSISYRPWRRLDERPRLRAANRFQVLARDGFRCVYCGATAKTTTLHVDHLVPVVKGGTDDMVNLVTSCAECNLGKGDREALPPFTESREA